MSNIVTAKGIILRAQKYQESDLIVSVILTSGEKLSLIARGAMKSKKRFSGGVLEPSHFIELQFKRSKNEHQLATLEGASILEDFSGLRLDYDRMELALFCLLCVGRISQEGDHESQGLFNLLGHSLRVLQRVKNLNLFKVTFCIKLLFQQGVLEIEAWMHPFLKLPLAELPETNENLYFSLPQLNWMVSRVEGYLQTAGTHLE